MGVTMRGYPTAGRCHFAIIVLKAPTLFRKRTMSSLFPQTVFMLRRVGFLFLLCNYFLVFKDVIKLLSVRLCWIMIARFIFILANTKV